MKLRNLLAIVLVVILLLSGCSKSVNAMAGNAAMDMESDGLTAEGSAPQKQVLPAKQKLIRKVWIDAETEAMDELLVKVETRIGELDGYVEERQVYNGSAYSGRRYRHADLTIRIPAEKLEDFTDDVAQISNITSTNETTDDVTLSYVATESQKIALETEQTRLLELLAKAEDMGDLLMIESRLTEVRAELEQVKSQLRLFDNLVSYGTIHLSISEVREYTVVEEEPETVWERISTGFVKSLKGLWKGVTEIFVFLVVALPYLAVFGLLITGVVLLVRLRRKKKFQRPIQTDFEKDES